MESIAGSLVCLFARSEKEESCRTNFRRKRDPTAKRKTSARAARESTELKTQTEHLWVSFTHEVTFGALLSRFGDILGLRIGENTESTFRAIFGGPKVGQDPGGGPWPKLEPERRGGVGEG